MCFFVGFPEPAGTDVGVNLGGCEAFVSEEFLDAAEIGSAIQQVCGEGVSECVGCGLLGESGGGDMVFEESADAAGCQAATETIEEHG